MHGARGLHLVASGHRHPETVLTTEQLERTLPNLEIGWVDKRLGMHARRVASPHERMADLAAEALVDALGKAGWTADQLDLIVCGASFLEELMPSRASVISELVNSTATAFDVNAACSSFLYALATAGALMRSDPEVERAAVAVVERPTLNADYRDSHSSVFFGDSCAVVLLTEEPPDHGFEILNVSLQNDSDGSEAVRVGRHGTFSHDNQDAFRHVVRMGLEVAQACAAKAGFDLADVKALVGHQANASVLGALGEQFGFPLERQWHNFEWAGNQGAAGVATAFSQGWQERESDLKPGDVILLNTVGSGYTSGAALLRWLG